MYFFGLFISAILPVIVLCFFIYFKDKHKEPFSLLLKMFLFGFLSFIPVLVLEICFELLFPTDGIQNFLIIFLCTLMNVAILEEGFKWLITRFLGYNSREFNEVYDIVVYSVFTSLGFACVENIAYVFQNGFNVVALRAFLSVPGHMCFAVIMGSFLAKAKVASFNRNHSLYVRFSIFSFLFPVLFHTMYDSLIFYYIATEIPSVLYLFFFFYVVMLFMCFIIVHVISKLQLQITTNSLKQTNKDIPSSEISFCPVCGNRVDHDIYCSSCGKKIR